MTIGRKTVIEMKKKTLVIGSRRFDPKKWDWKDFKSDIDDYY